jgi:hypothetical protein
MRWSIGWVALLQACCLSGTVIGPAPGELSGLPDGEGSAVAAVPVEPEPASAPAWVAWWQAEDGSASATAVFGERDGQVVKLGEGSGRVLTGFGGGAWSLGVATGTIPLVPCGEPADGTTAELVVSGLPGDARRSISLVDPAIRPPAGESHIHSESVRFDAQVGSMLLATQVVHTSSCPVPAGGEHHEIGRAIDLATGARLDLKELYRPDELEMAEAAALNSAVADVLGQWPDAPSADLPNVLSLMSIDIRSDAAGKPQVQFHYGGSADYFETPEGFAAASVAGALPSRLAQQVQAPPAPIVAFWSGAPAGGRGFAPVDPAARDAILEALGR